MPQERSEPYFRVSSSVRTGLGLVVGSAIALGGPLCLGSFAQTETSPQPGIFKTPSQAPSPSPQQSPAPTSTTPSTTTSQPRFACQLEGGQYKVMYNPESRPNELFPWAVPSAMGGGWTSERRCVEISRRLEEYRPDGLLEMQTSTENNYNTVCATTQSSSACRIIFTVPPGQDPTATRDQVFQNLTTADSGQQTQGINTFVNGQNNNWLGQIVEGLSGLGGRQESTSGAINLRPFLDPADGGTGAAITRGVPARSNPQLNPDQFR